MRFFKTIIIVVLLSYALSFWLAVPANPEIQFWANVQARRAELLKEIRQSGPNDPVVIFTGGSSCAFSVVPSIIESECGLSAINMGLPAGTGPQYIVDQALRATRPGDVLVLALEPDFFTDVDVFPPNTLAFGLALAEGKPSSAAGGDSFNQTLKFSDWLNLPRPGLRYLLALASRRASKDGYRYTMNDYREGGRLETSLKMDHSDFRDIVAPRVISPKGKELLMKTRKAADERGVRIYYTIPWLLTSAENAELAARSNQRFLQDIDRLIPVLWDHSFGVSIHPDHFSDSNLHLSHEGATKRSIEIGSSLWKVIRKSDGP